MIDETLTLKQFRCSNITTTFHSHLNGDQTTHIDFRRRNFLQINYILPYYYNFLPADARLLEMRDN